jgi:hypothetical protein
MDTGRLPPRLLSVRSVAREIDCSMTKIRALIAAERKKPGTGLKSVRIDGSVRVQREDLEEWLAQWTGKPTGSGSTGESGAPSSATGETSNGIPSALRRQKALGRMGVPARG